MRTIAGSISSLGQMEWMGRRSKVIDKNRKRKLEYGYDDDDDDDE